MKRLLALLLPFLLAVCAATAIADDIHVLELRHRPAEQVMPLVRPLLKPEHGLSGTGFRLLLRADQQTVESVRAALIEIDRPARSLIIHMRRASEGGVTRDGASISGHIEGTVIFGDARHAPSYGGSGSSIDARIDSRRRSTSGNAIHSLRMVEGQRAFIRSGQTVAYPTSSVFLLPSGPVASGGIDYKEVGSGFAVLPWITDDGVLLEIEPVHETLRPRGDGSTDVQRMSTTVRVRFGEWVSLGGVREDARTDDLGLTRSHRTRRAETSDVQVMVEPAD
ncbi:MAG: hypothetical protein PHQ14_10200 [Chromatiales bacterium]|nr:hypothetical protein [Chromatiales bacterium]